MLQQVIDRVEQIKMQLSKLGYPEIEFAVDVEKLKKGYAGLALCYSKRIKISSEFLAENTKEVINQTVPHEVVHLYVHKYFPQAKQAHGPEFRYMMNLLNLDGRTYHSMSVSTQQRKRKTITRYIYESAQTGKIVKLTAQKHKKQQQYVEMYKESYYTYKGESLIFTGKQQKIVPKISSI